MYSITKGFLQYYQRTELKSISAHPDILIQLLKLAPRNLFVAVKKGIKEALVRSVKSSPPLLHQARPANIHKMTVVAKKPR